MGNGMKTILTRRSVRRYTPEKVSEKDIQGLLEAAMAAPSAGDEQPWEFVVIRAREKLDWISKNHPHAKMIAEAPVAILVCGDLEKEVHKGYWAQDCAAAVENALLAAHDKGLGAVWVGVYPREERVRDLRKLLQIPEHVVPFALISLGRPAEFKLPSKRFDKKKIHYDCW